MLTQAKLLDILQHLPDTNRYLIAYSGGRDSHVLLHLLYTLGESLNAELTALHVDHGLQVASREWADHCVLQCELLQVPLQIIRLDLVPERGESPEAQARGARYGAISDSMERGDILLTAHHQDDQAETLLLQLLRGAGPSGLAAMPAAAAFGKGHHARPLLSFPTGEIEAYALAHRLEWIEDPSNCNTSFDRNYLRQKVVPLLSQRWPAVSRTLSRSARHCAEAQAMIDDTAEETLHSLLDPESGTLPVPALKRLPPPRTRAVLRRWIRHMGYPIPDTARLDRIVNEALYARSDRNPMVHWPGVELRRYRDRLYLMQPLTHPAPALQLEWKSGAQLQLPAGLGRLTLHEGAGGISEETWRRGKVQIRLRQQGERFRPTSGKISVNLKKFFQQRGIPPWERSRTPLIYIDGNLAAVGDLCICHPFQCSKKRSLLIFWDKCD